MLLNKMNMSFEKTKSQTFFESFVQPLAAKGNVRPRDIVNINLSNSQRQHMQACLREDSRHYFFKGVFTLLNALNSLDEKLFSWATVKLYYSVFYNLRSCLAVKGVGLFRWERDAFYLAYDKTNFQKMDGLHKSDHKGVIFLQEKYFSTSDKLLQSKVESKFPYYWLMDQREFVNYKHKTFEEPNTPFFWSQIKSILEEKDINYLIDLYLNDIDLNYCFDEDHSILATPLQRLKQTCQDFDNSGVHDYLESDKIGVTSEQIECRVNFEKITELIATNNMV